MALAVKISEGDIKEEIPNFYSQELKRVINLMLTRDPNKRISVDDLLNVPSVSCFLSISEVKKSQKMIEK